MTLKFRYQLCERLSDGTLWKQDLEEAAQGPCPDYPQEWQRDAEAMQAVLAGMANVSKGSARWAIDPDTGKFLFGMVMSSDPKLSGRWDAKRLCEALRYETIDRSPFQ